MEEKVIISRKRLEDLEEIERKIIDTEIDVKFGVISSYPYSSYDYHFDRKEFQFNKGEVIIGKEVPENIKEFILRNVDKIESLISDTNKVNNNNKEIILKKLEENKVKKKKFRLW